MNNTLKCFLVFGAITVLLVLAITYQVSYPNPPYQKPVSEIKAFSYDNDSVRCFYIDNNGIKSYLSCVQVESQTVLK